MKLKRSKLIRGIILTAYRLFLWMPMQPKRVVFESYLGRQYSCNPKAIYEYMKQNHPDYEFVWSIDQAFAHNFAGLGLTTIPRFTLKWFYTMATSGYWVLNSRSAVWLPKRKRTTYLQTWHGTPLKRIGLEIDNVTMSGIDTATYQCDFKKESQKWDMLISPNPYSSGIFRRAFQFDKTLVETGYPRNDVLTNGNTPATIAALKRKFGLPSHKKVILYAPTWRDDQYYATGRYSFDLQLDITHCYQQLGEEYIIILRTHYLISRQLDVGQFDGFVFDFSNKGDIQELYLVADVLVTDYSSTYFDYAVLNRPMLFFAYDLPQYEKQIRSFYVEYEQDVPGPIVTTTAQLIEQIQHLKVEEWDATRKAFRNRYCNWDDGQAAARCVAELLNPKNKTRG